MDDRVSTEFPYASLHSQPEISSNHQASNRFRGSQLKQKTQDNYTEQELTWRENHRENAQRSNQINQLQHQDQDPERQTLYSPPIAQKCQSNESHLVAQTNQSKKEDHDQSHWSNDADAVPSLGLAHEKNQVENDSQDEEQGHL